jgi:LuxR family maltose regulon positive regulatory protein
VLFVTENTVKTHVSAVYRKLGVVRRADALRRAREIGLI